MAQAIRTGRPHRASGALALHVLEVMEAFQTSSDAGKSVAISTRPERPAPMPRLARGRRARLKAIEEASNEKGGSDDAGSAHRLGRLERA